MTPQKGDKRPWRDFALASLWALIGLLALAFLVARSLLVITSPGAGIGVFLLATFGILLCLYVLFLLEGLLAAAVQIHKADEEMVEFYLATSDQFRRSQDVIRKIVVWFQKRFDEFVMGRQLLSVLMIVTLAQLIAHLPIAEDHPFFAWLETQQVGAGDATRWVLDTSVVDFLAAVLIPCWLAQLLPQLMVHRRALGFCRLTGSRFVVQAALFVNTTGAAIPSQWLFKRLKGFLEEEERFGVGDQELFDLMKRYYKHFIGKRVITVIVHRDKCMVSDASTFVFEEGTHEGVHHLVRVPASVSGSVKPDFKYQLPTGVDIAEPRVQAVISSISMVTADGAEDRGASDVIMSFETEFLTGPLPRDGKSERVEITAQYTVSPISLTMGELTSLQFDIQRPTQALEIHVKCVEGTGVQKPSLEYFFIDDGLMMQKGQKVPKGASVERNAEDDGWVIKVDYPPAGRRVVLPLDCVMRARGGDCG